MRQAVFSSRSPRNRTGALTALTTLAASMLLMQANIAHAEDGVGVTTINNIAQTNYKVGNSTQTGISNQVSFKSLTLPEYDVSITEPPLQTVNAGDTAQWINVLSNNGTYDEDVIVSFDYPNTLSNFVVYQDINNNGKFNEGVDKEIVLDSNLTAQIALGQSESIQLIVQALTDRNAASDDTAEIKIGAVVVQDESVTAAATDRLIIVKPSIGFTDENFESTQNTTQVGSNVFVEANYAQCNVQPNAKDQVWVTITSELTGDKYSLKATETGDNTGKYQVSAPTRNNANAIDDEIIQTLQGDTLAVTLDACITPEGDRVNIDSNISSNITVMDQSARLQVTKEGDVKTAELGDYVNYSINITNNGAATAYDVELKDALPRGFAYIEGSARITQGAGDADTDLDINQAQTTEFKAEGKYQVLNLGTLAVGETKNVTYRVLVGASALGGDGINRAIAVANNEQGQSIVSREAQWQIEVERGVMNTDGIIIGKVYHDINRDGIQQKEDGELGVAGVRIYMENGNFIVTDPEGKYNFYGVSAKTHVLKVDRTTIPNATELVIQSNRNTGDAGSRFVDLKYGELHRADFGIVGGMGDSTERLNEELIARSKSISAKNNALEQAIKSKLDLEPIYDRDYDDNVDASGCKSNDALDQGIQCDSAIVNEMVSPANERIDLKVNTITQPKEKVLEEFLKEVANNDVAFINLSEGQQLSSYKQMVQVQAPLGSSFTLYANGKAVSEQQIGKTAEQEKQK